MEIRNSFLTLMFAVLALFSGQSFSQESVVLVDECAKRNSSLLAQDRLGGYWRSANERAEKIAQNGAHPKTVGEWWAERFSLEGFYQFAGENKWTTPEDEWVDSKKRSLGVKVTIPFNFRQQLQRQASARASAQESEILNQRRARSEFLKRFIDLRDALGDPSKVAAADKVALDIAALSPAFEAACVRGAFDFSK